MKVRQWKMYNSRMSSDISLFTKVKLSFNIKQPYYHNFGFALQGFVPMGCFWVA